MLFGAVLLGGLIFGKPLLGVVFDSLFHLTEEGWRKLTLRWALFFLALAVLNEIVWRSTSTDVWVNFKVFGVMPLTLRVRRAAVSAAEEIRRRAGLPGLRAGMTRHEPEAPSAFSISGLIVAARFSGVIGPTSL